MSETPIEPEPQLSAQPSLQPDPESGLQLQLLLTPLPQQRLSESLHEHEHEHEHQAQLREEAKPAWINHRRLLLLLLGFSLSAAILGLIFYIQQSFQAESSTVASCLSPECQGASARLSMSVDPFAHPCDYFLFTCGSDRPSTATGERQKWESSLGQAQSQEKRAVQPQRRILDRKAALLQYLREILESNDRSTSSAVQKAKGFHRSCSDTRSIESAGVEPFLALIQKLGGWEVSGQWNQTSDFNSTLSLLMRDYATFPFFNLYVGEDPKEIARGTTKRYIQIDQPDLLIPIEWNRKTQKSQATTQTLRPFLASCQRYMALLGAPSSTIMVHVGMFISLSSELAVAAAPLSHRRSEGQLNQRMTITELQAVFHPQPITKQDYVLLHNIPYIVQMSHIIGRWLNKDELVSRRPLQTFMVLNLLHTLKPALDSRFETAGNLSVALGDNPEPQVVPRWKRCVLETERGFDSVLTHLLGEKIAHRETEEIIHNILSSFKSKLLELKWTDQTAYQSVETKVQSLIPRLWTSTEISSEAELDLLFSEVHADVLVNKHVDLFLEVEVALSEHSFFSNYIQLLSLWQKRRSKLLDPQTYGVDILSVKPFLRDKELIFPMGMFVPPLFHPTYPRAMNYGALGFLIARDILHLLLPDILTQSGSVREVGECVWAHYVTATEKAGGGGGGGGFTLSAAQQQEVWVQYSALQIALQAYLQSLRRHPDDTSLAGFSHTHLFLRVFSQVNCDSDPHRDSMPLEPSFLITVICAKSGLCPSSLDCPDKTQERLSPTC